MFWQQVSERQRVTDEVASLESSNGAATNGGSLLVEGSWATEIHEQNVEKLNQMTREDILCKKRKLEAILKPELIQFLKDKKNKSLTLTGKGEKIEKPDVPRDQGTAIDWKDETAVKRETVEKINEGLRGQVTLAGPQSREFLGGDKMKELPDLLNKEDDSTAMDVDRPEESVPKPSIELIEEAKKKGWVHMDAVEPEKLKWMEDLPAEKTDQPAPNEPYNARFDFNGVLLAYKDENVTLEKGLHHHGEEPERPGYSLQELLQLSRSSAQQQRCTALTTLANIVEKSRKGWYDKALQPPPLTALNERNLLLLLRFSLDDTSVAIVTATLQALRAFLFSEADEVCLDRLYGLNNYKEPILMPSNGVSDTNDLKDHELAQLDAVAALLRTDILLRIRYILSEIRPPPIGVTCALEILIRIARHSKITALNIASVSNLLETVVANFLPLSADPLAMGNRLHNVYGIPVTTAVRFCRILVCYGGKPVALRLDRLKVVQSIMSYVSCDAGREVINLSIESLRLWKALLLHDVATDSVIGAQLILIAQLQLLLSNHDLENASELSCEYAASLIAVASCLSPLRANLSVLLTKWSTQLSTLTIPTWCKTKLIAETLLAVEDAAVIQKLAISRSQVFSKLGSTSNLLSDCTMAAEREPTSLPNLGVLTEDGQLQLIITQQSCVPFLTVVLNAFTRHVFVTEIQAVFDLPEMNRYLKNLETTDWSLERSWYTRTELSFVTAIVKAAFSIRDKLTEKLAHVVWTIAVKLVSSLPADFSSDVKEMLRIALSEEKLNAEILANELTKLNLNSNIGNIKMNLNRDVASLYERYVAFDGAWDQAAMPKDWLYLPVVHVYTKCRSNRKCTEEDESNVLTVLSLELILPDLVEKLSQSLRFSRLVLVYLCDTLYLNEDVSVLLYRATTKLLRDHYETLNFTIDVPGLNSFTDLFTAICEQFSSTSYGDSGFSMILLVLVAQRHDVHYRKLLWSEHAAVLRYLRLPLEQLVIPLKEYLYPVEEDTSLIDSYMTTLVRGIVKQDWCPVPYAIALHHSAMYLKQSNKLAMRMRAQVEKLREKNLASILLNYEPPAL